MSKASLENALKAEALEVIKNALSDHYDLDPDKQICVVSANEFAIPVVDAEHNDKFLLIKVSTPRGTRNAAGTYDEYDGYAAAEDYRLDCETKQAKADKRAADKAKNEAEKERKRQARETIKKLNKDGLDKMIHEGG